MKLGAETGSLVNHLSSRMTIGAPEPVVGMGATVLGWTDRHAATVIDVAVIRKQTVVTVQHDDARVVSGSAHDGSAKWETKPDPAGNTRKFSRRSPNDKWHEVSINPDTGRLVKSGGYGLLIGQRDHYRDPSF